MREKYLYRISVSRTDTWTYHIKASSEAEAERAALADFRKNGGSGGEARIDTLEEVTTPLAFSQGLPGANPRSVVPEL